MFSLLHHSFISNVSRFIALNYLKVNFGFIDHIVKNVVIYAKRIQFSPVKCFLQLKCCISIFLFRQ